MRKLRTIEMNRLSIDEYHVAEKLPLVVVLDDVRSLYNVGSVFRTADAFRLTGLCLCGITATPPHNEIHKTALGAEDSVDWQYFASALEAVTTLQRGEGSASGGGRCLRRVHRDRAIRHQALDERERHRRYCHLGNAPKAKS